MRKIQYLVIFIVVLCLFSINTYSQWIQVGNDIIGEDSLDRAGCSVSMNFDGSIVAIGAKSDDGNGNNSGQVRVYKHTGGNWIQIGSDIYGEDSLDYSGHSVCLNDDGNIIAIGAPENDGNGIDAGHVRVYENIGGNWIQVGSDIDGDETEDLSGLAIDLNSEGNIIAIGSPENDVNGNNSGLVKIYEFNGGDWVQIGDNIYGDNPNDNFGYSVSLNSEGNILALGAPENIINGFWSGQVKVFKHISSTWTQMGSDFYGVYGDFLGWSVSLNKEGNILAIGAIHDDGPDTTNTARGQVNVYRYDGVDWVQLGNNIYGEYMPDESGWSISLSNSGEIIAIGAPSNNENGNYSGNVRVFEYSGTDWIQIGDDIDGDNAFDYFGYSVSLSSDGTILAVGAPSCNYGNENLSGLVKIYKNCNLIDTSLSQNIDTLTANIEGVLYQWVDCNNSYVQINGATNQSYIPTSNGNYAVIISNGFCTDTSSCYTVSSVNKMYGVNTAVSVYPNPTKDKITINAENIIESVNIINIQGIEIFNFDYSQNRLKCEFDFTSLPKGIYLVKVTTMNSVIIEKVVVE